MAQWEWSKKVLPPIDDLFGIKIIDESAPLIMQDTWFNPYQELMGSPISDGVGLSAFSDPATLIPTDSIGLSLVIDTVGAFLTD